MDLDYGPHGLIVAVSDDRATDVRRVTFDEVELTPLGDILDRQLQAPVSWQNPLNLQRPSSP